MNCSGGGQTHMKRKTSEDDVSDHYFGTFFKLSPVELGSHKNVRVGAISAMDSILSHVTYGLHMSHARE